MNTTTTDNAITITEAAPAIETIIPRYLQQMSKREAEALSPEEKRLRLQAKWTASFKRRWEKARKAQRLVEHLCGDDWEIRLADMIPAASPQCRSRGASSQRRRA
jgi:hypothetical protein